jgi:multisubunit Na+/H+ antiporter MnhB subunit
MTIAWAFDAILAATVLGVAGWTIAARQNFAAVVSFVAFGLLLALVWVRLRAPDVALTEAAVSVALAATVLSLPEPAPTLASAAAANLAQTGVGNPVTGVLMAFRALDTLLEKVVLVLALIGVWSLAPDRLWGGVPGPQRHERPDEALVFLARLLPPVGIVLGVYLLWAGADEPGGAFQGGALLAAMWLLAMIGGLTAAPALSDRRLRLLLVGGPAVFLAIGFAGFALADAFLAYPEAYAKPLIIVIEVALILSIAATLGLLVAGPPERSPPR